MNNDTVQLVEFLYSVKNSSINDINFEELVKKSYTVHDWFLSLSWLKMTAAIASLNNNNSIISTIFYTLLFHDHLIDWIPEQVISHLIEKNYINMSTLPTDYSARTIERLNAIYLKSQLIDG